MIRLKKIMIWF